MKKDSIVNIILVIIVVGIAVLSSTVCYKGTFNRISDLEDQVYSMNEQIIYLEKEIDKLHVDILNETADNTDD